MELTKLPHRLDVFYWTVRLGSFVAAADKLELSSSMVSQHIAKLEQELNAKLINRTTRMLMLTTAGEILFNTCRQLFEQLEQSLQTISETQHSLSGPINVSSQSDFGALHLIPLAQRFMELHPWVQLDIRLDDEVRNLLKYQIDISFTVGKLRDSSYHAVRIAPFQLLLCAAPHYLEKYGTPETLADLSQHQCVLLGILDKPAKWTFTGVDNQATVVTMNKAIIANSSQGLQAFVKAGAGLGVIPDFIIRQALKDGQLQTVLPHYHLPFMGIYAVYPNRQHIPERVRAFIQYVREYADFENQSYKSSASVNK